MRKVMFFLFVLLTGASVAQTPVSYDVQGQVYQQNFDGLPAAGTFAITGKGPFTLSASPFNAVNLTGWQLLMYGGTGTNASFLTSTGSSTGNGVQSLGLAGSTDRALGSLSAGTAIYSFGVLLTNNTGITLNSFTLAFTAEQWRKGGSGNKNTWSFHYKTGVFNSIDQSDLLADPQLNFSSTIFSTGAGSLNGNLAANRTAVSYTLTGITWKPGEQLLLRWDDADEQGSDDACAIDDLRFSAEQVEDIPSVMGKPVTEIGTNSAIINCIVNDNNAGTSVSVEYDTSASFLSVKSMIYNAYLDPGTGATAILIRLDSLLSGTRYYYRVRAVNRNGSFVTPPSYFNTLQEPVVVTQFHTGASRTYKWLDTLLITVKFSKKIWVVSGSNPAYIKLMIGNAQRQALYLAGSGTDSLQFAYAVISTDEDTSGVKIANTVTTGNSTIRDSLGNAAVLSLPVYMGDPIRVDGIVPRVNTVTVPGDSIYRFGDTLTFSVLFSEKLHINAVADIPQLKITVGSSSKNLLCSGISDNQTLLFSYTIQNKDLDKTGIGISALTTAMANTLTDLAGNVAVLTLKNIGSLANVKIDAVSPQFVSADTVRWTLCENSSAVALTDLLQVTDEEKGEDLRWEVTSRSGGIINNRVSVTNVSTGGKLFPPRIDYTLTGKELDTLTASISDGVNMRSKIVVIGTQHRIRDNRISVYSFICQTTGTAIINGTNPSGGNNSNEFIWESSIISDTSGFLKVSTAAAGKDLAVGKITAATWYRRRTNSGACSDTSQPVKMVPLKYGLWLGAYSSDWRNGNNWCGLSAPAINTDVYVSPGSPHGPVITDTASCHDIHIEPTDTLRITGSLRIAGSIFCAPGTIDATTGGLVFSGRQPQVFSSLPMIGRSLNRLVIDNDSGLVLLDTLQVLNNLQLTAGYLQTNNHLFLPATATISSSASGTLINGLVTAEQIFNDTRTQSLLLGSPFSAAVDMRMNVDSNRIDNRPTSLSSNHSITPIAFRFDPLHATDSALIDKNWLQLTAADDVASMSWLPHAGIRLLLPGKQIATTDNGVAKNVQGPGDVSIPLSIQLAGPVTIGDMQVKLLRGIYSSYNLVANPYLVPVDISRISHEKNVSEYCWIWDTNLGRAGAYRAMPLLSGYLLPKFGAFFMKALDSSATTVVFTENCKAANDVSSDNSFWEMLSEKYIELSLETDTIVWDKLLIYHSDSARAAMDKHDADKMINPEVSFYSLSRDNQKLSVDARQLSNSSIIHLGLQSNAVGTFLLRISKCKLPSDNTLQLHDRYLNQWTALKSDSTYSFTVTNDTASAGDNRFEIITPSPAVDPLLAEQKVTMRIRPMPVATQLIISYNSSVAGEVSIRLMNLFGNILQTLTLGEQVAGTVMMPVAGLIPGVYVLELRSGKYSISRKIIKQ